MQGGRLRTGPYGAQAGNLRQAAGLFDLQASSPAFPRFPPPSGLACTPDFEKTPTNTLNFREVISPKNRSNADTSFHPKEYTQVFSDKFKFIPNLSILDLLFNEGPNSYTILEESLRR